MGKDRGDEYEGIKGPLEAMKCSLTDTSPMSGREATWALIILNVLVYIVTGWFVLTGLFLGDIDLLRSLPKTACMANLSCPTDILLAQVLHATPVHLIGNMVFLYIVGDNVEAVLGKKRYLLLYLASGIAGVVANSTIALGLMRENAPPIAMGSSAAISGLIGAYLLFYPGANMCYCIGYGAYYCFRVKVANLLAFWILYQIPLAFASKTIGVFAHLTGVFVGIALASLIAPQEKIRELRRLFEKGWYRGVPPFEGELQRPSLGSGAKTIVVLAAVLLAGSAAASLFGLYAVDGMMYSLVARAYYTPYGQVAAVNDTWVIIAENPPPTIVEDVRGSLRVNGAYVCCIVAAPIWTARLDHVFHVGLAVAALIIVSTLQSFKALSTPEAYEVTYTTPYNAARSTDGGTPSGAVDEIYYAETGF